MDRICHSTNALPEAPSGPQKTPDAEALTFEGATPDLCRIEKTRAANTCPRNVLPEAWAYNPIHPLPAACAKAGPEPAWWDAHSVNLKAGGAYVPLDPGPTLPTAWAQLT